METKHDHIKSAIVELEFEEYRKRVLNKFKTEDYINWQNFLEKLDYNLVLKNDTTSNNASFTAIAPLNRRHENVTIKDYLIIQKSVFKDFICIYIKSKIVVLHKNSEIAYPWFVIASNEGYYEHIFSDIYMLLTEYFSNCVYVPYRAFYLKLDTKFETEKNAYDLIFGYEGDITRYPVIGNKYFSP